MGHRTNAARDGWKNTTVLAVLGQGGSIASSGTMGELDAVGGAWFGQDPRWG